MKSKRNLILLLLPLILVASCKKNKEYIPGDTTYLKGYVIDVSTQEPIAMQKYSLLNL